MPYRFLVLTLLLGVSTALSAQTEREPAPHYQLFGGYSYFSNAINGVPGSRQALNGWNVSMTFPLLHDLHVKADVSGYTGTNLGAPEHPFFLLGGAQYNKRFQRETVFVEGLIGDGGINRYWGANKTAGETASFSAVAGGGLDTHISKNTAIRVQADTQYAYFWLAGTNGVPYRIPNLPTHFLRLSSGLVWKF